MFPSEFPSESDSELFSFEVTTRDYDLDTVRLASYIGAEEGVVSQVCKVLVRFSFLKEGDCSLVRRNFEILRNFGLVLAYKCTPVSWGVSL